MESTTNQKQEGRPQSNRGGRSRSNQNPRHQNQNPNQGQDRGNSSRNNPQRDRNPASGASEDQAVTNVKNLGYLLWYFLVGAEAVYHLAKGVYLTAFFNLYQPFMDLVNHEESRMYFGQALFSVQEWSWHFKYGLRGPAMLFTAWLLYRYLKTMNPWQRFKSKSRSSGRNHSNRRNNQHGQQNRPRN